MTDDTSSLDGELLGDDALWNPWTPDEVAALLADVSTRWYVVAGWAIDLSLGAETRLHEDVEIGVPVSGFAELRDVLHDYDCCVVGSKEGERGMRWPLTSPAFDEHFQTWFSDPSTGEFRLDVFRDPHDADTWLCRRDTSIRLPYDDLIRSTPTGIPYMTPEVALLFKAKHTRDKDCADFFNVLPLLNAQQVEWLRTHLAQLHPGHPWLADL